MTSPEQTAPDDAAVARVRKRARIEEGLKLNRTVVKSAQDALDRARQQRKELILLGLEGAEANDNVLTYAEISELTGMSSSAVYKAIGKKRATTRAEPSA